MPAVRKRIVERVADTHALSEAVADAVVLTCIDALLETAPRRFAQEEARSTRNTRLLEMIQQGFTNAEVGDALGVTAARVAQLLAEMKCGGIVVPERKRGPKTALMGDALLAAPLFRAGLTVPEIAQRLKLSEPDVVRLHGLLRRRGDAVPPMRKVRDELDDAKTEFDELRAAHAGAAAVNSPDTEALRAKTKAAANRYRTLLQEAGITEIEHRAQVRKSA
jgi:predicted transcriptional regulator